MKKLLTLLSLGSILNAGLTELKPGIQTHKELINSLGNGLTIVKFYADWCGPCIASKEHTKNLATANEDITIIEVNIDKHENLAKEMNVNSVPTLVFYKEKEIHRQSGFDKKQVQTKIQELKA